jgi:hypothetical protein
VPISLATDSFTAIISVISARGATHIIPVAPLLFYVAGSGAVGIVDLGGRLEITAEAPAPAAPAANGDDATHVERAFADPSAPST